MVGYWNGSHSDVGLTLHHDVTSPLPDTDKTVTLKYSTDLTTAEDA